MFFTRVAMMCITAVTLALPEASALWGVMDKVNAADLFPREFRHNYVMRNKPVIIRGDPSALAVSTNLTIDVIMSLCGNKMASLGNRVAKVLQHGITPAMYKILSERMNYTDGVTLDEAIIELNGNGPTRTIRDYFEGPFFSNPVKTAHDPRFPGALKDWSSLSDYMWPPSIRTWGLERCHNLVQRIREILDEPNSSGNERRAIQRIPYVRAMFQAEGLQRPYRNPASTIRMFASGDNARGSPAHTHGYPSHSVMLVVKGAKRMVSWPEDQKDKLYPLWANKTGVAENGEVNGIFMANGFNMNLTRQPALQDVVGGLEGQAEAGDLIYIPCGVVHALHSVGESIALAWIRTEKVQCPRRVST